MFGLTDKKEIQKLINEENKRQEDEERLQKIRAIAKEKIKQLTTNGNNLATQASVWHEVLQIIGE